MPAGGGEQGLERQWAEFGVTIAVGEEGTHAVQLGGFLKATSLPELSTMGGILDEPEKAPAKKNLY